MMFTIFFWAIFTVALFAIELFTLSLFFLFASLGSVVTLVSISTHIIAYDAYLTQLIVFLASTIVIFLIFLKPLIKLRKKRASTPEYNDVIGQNATVYQKPLVRNEVGSVKWNGVVMLAKLDKLSKDTIETNEMVKIVAVDGNILIVRENESR